MIQTVRNNQTPENRVDLDEVARLVAQLEQDLHQARTGAKDLQTLRDEVERLRAALAQPASDSDDVDAGLRELKERFSVIGDELFDDAVTASRYAAWIGKLLGL